MPVSLVKPASTDCGTYSDQAKRFSSSAAAGAVHTRTLASCASTRDEKRFMTLLRPRSGASGVPAAQRLREEHCQHRYEDQDRRDRVERGIEPLLHTPE